jgi:hypothetical protein
MAAGLVLVVGNSLRELPSLQYGVCDTCGEPATHVAVDVQLVAEGYFKIHGQTKHGCDAHTVLSLSYDDQGRLLE